MWFIIALGVHTPRRCGVFKSWLLPFSYTASSHVCVYRERVAATISNMTRVSLLGPYLLLHSSLNERTAL